ncbi:MAG: hypothetical protein KC609_13010 [Myxococcales bacterium]|nr:hypothetical protein [Myxococcales bacterium]
MQEHFLRYLNRREFLRATMVGAAALAGSATLAGCLGDSGGSTGQNTQEQDIAQYDALTQQLAANLTQALSKEASYAQAIGLHLFYLKFNGFDPTLYSYHKPSGTTTTYKFSIGSGDKWDYRVSEQLISTADTSGAGDMVTYSVYAVDAEMQLVGQTAIAKPPSGVRWHEHYVDGDTIYFMVESATAHTLTRWNPATDAYDELLTLEQADLSVGEFWSFAVLGNTMLFTESGRLWSLDLETKQATWLNKDKTQISGTTYFDADGVFYTSAAGPHYIDPVDGTLVNLKERISANSYKLNETYKSIHNYVQDLTRYKKIAVYIGNGGVFAYDVIADKVWPILLSPRSSEIRIDYRYPTVLDDGTLFVTGLESTSGAVGAQGPTQMLPASAWLPA